MAFWKIVGLDVTPTTCLSRTSISRLPVTRRSRERSSSQIATPASVSCFKVSVTGVLLSVAGRGSPRRAHLRQRRVRRRHDALRGDAELLVEHLERRRRAEVLEGDGFPVVADEVAPAEGHCGLDRDAGADLRR